MSTYVRGPEEIKELYNQIKKRREESGKTYSKAQFIEDIGYTHRQSFHNITAPKDSPNHRGISKAVNRLMDVLEETL
jgi:hypothetical protein